MDIEQKLQYLRKALEAGAYIDVRFHNMHSRKEAESLATECSKMLNCPIGSDFAGFTEWFKIDHDQTFRTAIFFEENEAEVIA